MLVCLSFLCLCVSLCTTFITLSFLECDEEFSFSSAKRKRYVFLVQTVQVIFSNAYEFLSDSYNRFSDKF